MKKREAAIVSIYTGILIGKFDEAHKYAEEIIGRPVFTHEFADEQFAVILRDLSKKDFINLEITE